MEKSKKKAVNKKPARIVEPARKKGMSKQTKTTVLGVALMVLAIALGAGTFAYYQTTITGNVSGSITAWSFVVNNQSQSFTADMGDLKPGVTGTIPLNLSAEASGLGVRAVITFSGKTNWPTNLKLYSDSEYSSEIIAGTTTITENLSAGQAKTVTIYYKWDNTSAEEPLATTADITASITITVTGTQVNPNA